MELYVLSRSQAAAGLLGNRLWDRVVTESASAIFICLWSQKVAGDRLRHLGQCGVKLSHRQDGGLNLGLRTVPGRDRAVRRHKEEPWLCSWII